MSIIHRHRRAFVLAAVLLLAVTGIGYALRPETFDVDTSTARMAPLRATVDEDGRTRVKNRFVVTAPVAGKLERITLHEGNRVVRGTVVAWLAPLPLDSASRRGAQARLDVALGAADEASARVQQASAALDFARRTEARKKALLDAGALAAGEYEQAQSELKAKSQELIANQSRLRSARAEVAAARAELLPVEGRAVRRVPVRAPVDGQVLRLPEPSERVVSAGTPILELGDARSIEVVADVISSDAVRIRIGDKVEVEDWGGEKPLVGRVTLVEPAAFTRVSALGVEEQRVNVVIEIADPPASLGDGFRVEARIIVWESPSVLTVPSSSVFKHAGQWQVFTIENGRARKRTVTVGHSGSATIEITSGLSAGDHVILFPSDQVEEGVRVRPHYQE